MWRSMRKCSGLEELAVMEKAAEMADGRKRKIESGESELSTSSVQLKTRRLDVVTSENSGDSACQSISSDLVLASCCSSNGSSELAKECLKSADLEEENEVTFELFIATSAGDWADSRFRREATPPNDVLIQSGELESTEIRELNSRRHTTVGKMPSEAEVEEFFAGAEKNIQKKFIDRYNYDIVKDQPLEGRYEWVQLKP